MNIGIVANENSVLITFLASFLIWFMLGGLVILWVIDGRVKREQALHAFLAVILSWVISTMIKSLFPSFRPFQLYGILPLTITVPSINTSFPSAHASVAFAMATSIWIHNKKLGVRFLILAFLVALGRILSSVHFIHDVFVGALIGVFASYLIKRLHVFKLVD
jgi:undecaprenyl-diphosphatase